MAPEPPSLRSVPMEEDYTSPKHPNQSLQTPLRAEAGQTEQTYETWIAEQQARAEETENARPTEPTSELPLPISDRVLSRPNKEIYFSVLALLLSITLITVSITLLGSDLNNSHVINLRHLIVLFIGLLAVIVSGWRTYVVWQRRKAVRRQAVEDVRQERTRWQTLLHEKDRQVEEAGTHALRLRGSLRSISLERNSLRSESRVRHAGTVTTEGEEESRDRPTDRPVDRHDTEMDRNTNQIMRGEESEDIHTEMAKLTAELQKLKRRAEAQNAQESPHNAGISNLPSTRNGGSDSRPMMSGSHPHGLYKQDISQKEIQRKPESAYQSNYGSNENMSNAIRAEPFTRRVPRETFRRQISGQPESFNEFKYGSTWNIHNASDAEPFIRRVPQESFQRQPSAKPGSANESNYSSMKNSSMKDIHSASRTEPTNTKAPANRLQEHGHGPQYPQSASAENMRNASRAGFDNSAASPPKAHEYGYESYYGSAENMNHNNRAESINKGALPIQTRERAYGPPYGSTENVYNNKREFSVNTRAPATEARGYSQESAHKSCSGSNVNISIDKLAPSVNKKAPATETRGYSQDSAHKSSSRSNVNMSSDNRAFSVNTMTPPTQATENAEEVGFESKNASNESTFDDSRVESINTKASPAEACEQTKEASDDSKDGSTKNTYDDTHGEFFDAGTPVAEAHEHAEFSADLKAGSEEKSEEESRPQDKHDNVFFYKERSGAPNAWPVNDPPLDQLTGGLYSHPVHDFPGTTRQTRVWHGKVLTSPADRLPPTPTAENAESSSADKNKPATPAVSKPRASESENPESSSADEDKPATPAVSKNEYLSRYEGQESRLSTLHEKQEPAPGPSNRPGSAWTHHLDLASTSSAPSVPGSTESQSTSMTPAPLFSNLPPSDPQQEDSRAPPGQLRHAVSTYNVNDQPQLPLRHAASQSNIIIPIVTAYRDHPLTRRQGHGLSGSLQSDDNVAINNALPSDAETVDIDERFRFARREKAENKVGGWFNAARNAVRKPSKLSHSRTVSGLEKEEREREAQHQAAMAKNRVDAWGLNAGAKRSNKAKDVLGTDAGDNDEEGTEMKSSGEGSNAATGKRKVAEGARRGESLRTFWETRPKKFENWFKERKN